MKSVNGSKTAQKAQGDVLRVLQKYSSAWKPSGQLVLLHPAWLSPGSPGVTSPSTAAGQRMAQNLRDAEAGRSLWRSPFPSWFSRLHPARAEVLRGDEAGLSGSRTSLSSTTETFTSSLAATKNQTKKMRAFHCHSAQSTGLK